MEVRVMRDANTVLDIITTRGKKGLPLEGVYRQLFNPDLYLKAYGRIYRNDGAMTKGTTDETVDGMSIAKIAKIIEEIRYERYQWAPVRRVNIPKKKGGTRPLGIPTWSDKLVQEVVRSLLEAYYEPQFSSMSHGFRPGKGCHTALDDIYKTWKGAKWFIEADIKGCFDNINHDKLMEILARSIKDNRFLRLIKGLLDAGYLEQWKYNATLSGTPQGGIVSPLLANIYLNELDTFIEQTLIPEWNRGIERRPNPEYCHIRDRRYDLRKQGRYMESNLLLKRQRQIPSGDPQDPEYRRLRYVRYADDFVLGFIGTRAEAEKIKEQLKGFLAETLRLELSEEKTLITHATTEHARFLGYEISAMHSDTKVTNGQRSVNGNIKLRMPLSFLEAHSDLYGTWEKPTHRSELINDSDFDIIAKYQSQLRGYYEYYALAENVCSLHKLKRIMEVSLLKTLASKHKTSVQKIADKYKTTYRGPDGPRKCVELVIERQGKKPLITRFGGIALKRKHKTVLKDEPQIIFNQRTELIQRLLADECEACGSTEKVEVHHIRKMADIQKPGRKSKPDWMKLMSARRRKTMVLCRKCHDDVHAGRPLRTRPDNS
jgi:group II intron reverse transcriptase/maturase